MAADDLERAKNLLQGAVDAFYTMASQSQSSSQRPPPPPIQNTPGRSSSTSSFFAGSSSTSSSSSRISAIEEHRKIFGYKPSKGGQRRAKAPRKGHKGIGSGGKKTWKKQCICLRDKEQEWKPNSEEKMQLARMGLGLSEIIFDCGGDADSIHRAILHKFPVLDICGGYSLLRLAENSHSLVEIVGPEGGLTVPYLKDILNQAKLYIRPLQKDIQEEDMETYSLTMVCLVYCLSIDDIIIAAETVRSRLA